MVVKIAFFVNGITNEHQINIANGWNHGTLSNLGKVQNLELRDRVKNMMFDAVFTSDLTRASETAKTLFPNKYIIEDRRLRDCNFGDFNGASYQTVQEMSKDCIDVPFPGGESFMDVENRIREFLQDLKKMYEWQQVAVVSHRVPQLAFDVLIRGMGWQDVVNYDWTARRSWRPGWEYVLE